MPVTILAARTQTASAKIMPQPAKPALLVMPKALTKRTSVSKCQELKLQEVYNNSYGTTAEAVTALTVSEKIGIIISYMLAFLGVIFLVLVIYSGFQWLTAGGNEDKVKQARSRITNAVFGLIIILAAFAITNFIVGKIQNIDPPHAAEQTPE